MGAGLKYRKRQGNACWWSSQNTHLPSKFTVLYRCGLWHLKTITAITSKVTDDHKKYNDNEKL